MDVLGKQPMWHEGIGWQPDKLPSPGFIIDGEYYATGGDTITRGSYSDGWWRWQDDRIKTLNDELKAAHP